MIQVQGIIIPVAWDENGNVSEVGIETFDENFYLIDSSFELVQAKMLLRHAVEIFGILTKASDKKLIRVHRIRPIQKEKQSESRVEG
jgi:hypothetical protein